MRFDGKVVLVTEAASGIGLAAAVAFAREGAKVVLADRNSSLAETGAAAIRSAGGTATSVFTDGGTAIVNTASMASLVAARGMAAYVASKHGVGGLTKAAALDLITHGIRVNAICPGFVDTPMLAGAIATPESRAAVCAMAPIGRIATADEVAQTALFLASGAASYMVGVLLSVDGGVVSQ